MAKNLQIEAMINHLVEEAVKISEIEVEAQINFTLKKAAFFDMFEGILNDRALKLKCYGDINRGC